VQHGHLDAKTSEKPSSNRTEKDRRNTLFRVLDGVLSLSTEKFTPTRSLIQAARQNRRTRAEDKYIVKEAKTKKQEIALLEDGFESVKDRGKIALCRKRRT
jgi:hypothetical protein